MCVFKCWGWTWLPSSGVTQKNADLLPFDPGTWPWRVGCQTIAPEPRLARCHVSLLAAATRPKPSEDTAVCVFVSVCVKQQSLTLSEADLPSRADGHWPGSWSLSNKWSNRRTLILTIEGCFMLQWKVLYHIWPDFAIEIVLVIILIFFRIQCIHDDKDYVLNWFIVSRNSKDKLTPNWKLSDFLPTQLFISMRVKIVRNDQISSFGWAYPLNIINCDVQNIRIELLVAHTFDTLDNISLSSFKSDILTNLAHIYRHNKKW